MAARSFSTTATTRDALARPLLAARNDVADASGGLVLVSGAFASDPTTVVEAVRTAWPGIAACIVPAAGVLTERGELEGTTAAAGLLWSGGTVTPFATSEPDASPALASAVSGVLKGSAASVSGPPSSRRTTVLVFARAESHLAGLPGVAGAGPSVCVVGAGMTGVGLSLPADGTAADRGQAVGLVLGDAAAPLVGTSSACRLLGPLQSVDEVAGGMVLRVGGDTALDLLSSYAPGVQDVQNAQQNNIVLVALDVSAEAGSLEPIVVVRPVRGVDPGRRGVLVGSEVRAGMRMTFAVCDATVARAALEAVARTLAQHALGAAPRFALYLASARMGQNLHGAADVETRILRQRFGDLPIAGMRSPFEVFPGARGGVCVTEYAGVLSLFRSPS